MGRFIRDFGFLASVLLLPVGIYCLGVATENRGPDASLYLIGGAALASGGLVGICSSIREHFIMRDQVRYAHGKRGRETPDQAARP
jgi:hypothetical protein